MIHNDFRFDNLVLAADDPLRIEGVLDWEMATIGDPLMDLSGTLAYWVDASDDEFAQGFRRQPTTSPGMWKRADVLAHYAARTGRWVAPEQWRFYEVFALFRLAVIAQQIYHRYFHGQTHNEAHAEFGGRRTLFRGPLPVPHRRLMGQILLVRHGQATSRRRRLRRPVAAG